MTRRQRVAENLNSALHHLLGAHPGTYLIGEDVADPYGGAFKVTRGLSDRFPDRVLSSPLSEGGIAGVGAGLALAGNRSVVEMMFSDLAALAFDPLLNFAAKSVSMYGRRVPMSMVVRCPTGGNRGYGPTHSQSLQKHFLGIPSLHLREVSLFHDNQRVLTAMLDREEPGVLFEDKVLYTRAMYQAGSWTTFSPLRGAGRSQRDRPGVRAGLRTPRLDRPGPEGSPNGPSPPCAPCSSKRRSRVNCWCPPPALPFDSKALLPVLAVPTASVSWRTPRPTGPGASCSHSNSTSSCGADLPARCCR
ncbi:alpha-ketoacid dehydrogenase subunit beta [Streptomyces thinghirensis]|nr:alpha-ketoacid dehydrogenase subunit beta [Streptomyces thinghirensis]